MKKRCVICHRLLIEAYGKECKKDNQETCFICNRCIALEEEQDD